MQNQRPTAPTANPVLEPNTSAFLDTLAAQGGPPIYRLSIPEARSVLSDRQAGKVAALPVETQDRTIPGGPKGEVSLRIVRPKGKTGRLPGVVYFHGGCVLGDHDTQDRLVRELAHGAAAAVVFVNFAPSPEAHGPAAIEEAYAATKWVAANGASLNLDGLRLTVAGDSVGGNMAAAVTLLAKKRRGPRIAGQVLFYPVTDAAFDTGSYTQFAEGWFLTREAMKWSWNHYTQNKAARAQLTASPLRATAEQPRGLPPALVITAACDALHSSYLVLAPDLRGVGASEGAPRTTSMADCAADLHGLLQQLQTGPLVSIGHSMGGYLALECARRLPQMLRGLVLVATKAGPDTPEVAARRRATAEKVRAEGVKAIVEAMAPKMYAAGTHDATMKEHVRALMASASAEGVIAALLGMAERPDSTPMLGTIGVPTLVVTGAEDTLIPPAESEKLARAIPGARLNVIPRAGHFVACEQPEAFNRALREWLDRLGRSETTASRMGNSI